MNGNSSSSSSGGNDHKLIRNHEIIRKLGMYERYFHDAIEEDSFINASTLLIATDIDLFENKRLVDKAARLWKRTQPFLRSKVIKTEPATSNDQSTPVSEHEPDQKYFAFESSPPSTNDCNDNNNNTNVKSGSNEYLPNIDYVYYDGGAQSIQLEEDYWKLLVEREVSRPLDWRNGPMWRITLVNLDDQKQQQQQQQHQQNGTQEKDAPHMKHKYCLIIAVSHAIFDGISAFLSLAHLFTIIEYLVRHRDDQASIEQHLVDGRIVDPVEVCVRDHLARANIDMATLPEYFKVFKAFTNENKLNYKII